MNTKSLGFFHDNEDALTAFIHLVAELLRETSRCEPALEIREIAARIEPLADRLLSGSQPNPLSEQDKRFLVALCLALETVLNPTGKPSFLLHL